VSFGGHSADKLDIETLKMTATNKIILSMM
jgi:hypothetical protein